MTSKSTKPAQAPFTLGTSTTAQLGKIFDITRQGVEKLIGDGKLPKPKEKGQHDTLACVRAYIALQKAERSANTKTAAQTGVAAARQREIEQRIAERSRELVAVTDAIGALDDVVGTVTTELNALPAAFTRDRVLRRQLEQAIDGALGRISAKLDRSANDLRTGGEDATPDAEDGAGRMGGRA